MQKFMIPLAVLALLGSGCAADTGGNQVTPAQCGAGTVLFNGQCVVATDGTIADPTDTGGNVSDAGPNPQADSSGNPGVDSGSDPVDGGGTTGKDTAVEEKDAGPTDPWCDCPPEKKFPGGLEHGKKCDKHEDCLYGYCFQGGHLTGYDDSVKFCTKNNACDGGGDATQCEGDGKFKSGFEKTKESGNDKFSGLKCGKVVKTCAKECKSDSECKAWNAELPNCIKTSTKYVSMGVIGICVKNPL